MVPIPQPDPYAQNSPQQPAPQPPPPPPGDPDAEFYAILAKTNPKLLQQLVSAGLVGQQNELVNRQMAMADQLRQAPMPQGREAGGTFVASSPLEVGAAAAQRGLGNAMMKEGLERQGQNLQKLGQGRLSYLKALAGVKDDPGEGGSTGTPMDF